MVEEGGSRRWDFMWEAADDSGILCGGGRLYEERFCERDEVWDAAVMDKEGGQRRRDVTVMEEKTGRRWSDGHEGVGITAVGLHAALVWGRILIMAVMVLACLEGADAACDEVGD